MQVVGCIKLTLEKATNIAIAIKLAMCNSKTFQISVGKGSGFDSARFAGLLAVS